MKVWTAALVGISLGLMGCGGADDLALAGDENVEMAEQHLETKWPFDMNTTYRILSLNKDGTVTAQGFVFASTPDGGATQKQRWVLFNGPELPIGSVDFVRPGAGKQFATLAEWTTAIESGQIWRTNATYVKCTLSMYATTGSSGTTLLPDAWNGQMVDRSASIQFLNGDASLTMQGHVQGYELNYADATHASNTEVWTTSPSAITTLDAATGLRFDIVDSANTGKAGNATLPTGSTITKASCDYFMGHYPSGNL